MQWMARPFFSPNQSTVWNIVWLHQPPPLPYPGPSPSPMPYYRELRTPGGRRRREEPEKVVSAFLHLCDFAHSELGSNFFGFCRRSIDFSVPPQKNDCHNFSKLCSRPGYAFEVTRKSTTTPRSCQFHIFTCSFCLLQLVLFYRRCRRHLPSWCFTSLP